MKGFAGGRLFDAKRSPFGVALTPAQCIHYALTHPAVGAVMCGYDTKEQVDLLEHTASACIGCRACETRCPFGVPVAERMRKTAALFGC